MKKIILLIAFFVGITTVQAQVTLEGSKLTDNWSIGVNAGGITPLTYSKFIKDMRGVAGIELTKQVTPILGISLQGMFGFNTIGAPTIVDQSNVSLLGKLNLMNLFATYQGTPRLFEIEAVAGVGWLHNYGKGFEANNLSSKVGLNFNFNLCERKAWTVSVKPAIVWNMDGDSKQVGHSRLNARHAGFEILAGLTYHFKNSNGKHHFTLAHLYDKAEVDGLNDKINGLRASLNNKNIELAEANALAATLGAELTACKNKKPVVETKTIDNSKNVLESVITFAQGRSTISAAQQPNVERIASYMKNHKKSTVIIKGYASPEGSAEVNAKIATARAEAVKNMLVNKYKIEASRIQAEGQGVGDMFTEPDWNRVSICTLDETK